ncbi:MAG: mandelate racemase/muconate lactonizing enzyme family protein [Stappiaceae bacterium]
MKVTRVTVFDVTLPVTPSAGRQNAWIVEVETDEGLTGAGEIGLCYGIGGRGAAHVLLDLAEQYLIGADPGLIEKHHDNMVRNTFWGLSGGAVFMAAVSALDEALWDIKGKKLGAPIHALLGGAKTDSLRLYANGWYRGLGKAEAYRDAVYGVVQDGYSAFKFDPFKADLTGKAAHPRRVLTRELESLALERVVAAREAAPNADIIVEFHGNLWPADAIRFGLKAADLNPYFYEEVVDPLNVEAAADVARSVSVPLAGGERLWSRNGFRPFLENGTLKLVQPDLGIAGGFTEVQKIASLSESYCAYLQPHNCGGPISTAACVNLSAACPNFLIQEIFPYWTDGRENIVQNPYEADIKDGRLQIRDLPGLGVALNHDFLTRFDSLSVGRTT